MMNRLSTAERARVAQALCEGNSIRATCRMTGVAKGTVLRLLVDLGTACADYQDAVLRGLPCTQIQCDEIWTFIGAKERHVRREDRGFLDRGDVWTWTAICPDTKLVPSWLVGKRDEEYALAFMDDLASRMAGRVQLSTDGLRAYIGAVDLAFGGDVDFGMMVKVYGNAAGDDTRYSPPQVIGAKREVRSGNPDKAMISTYAVERQNLTMRMQMRRFTRLTNAFSKKYANLDAAVALHFMHYNFARPHGSLGGRTPAMAAGVSRYRWSIEEIVGLLAHQEPASTRPRQVT